jgi:hypothetical protein
VALFLGALGEEPCFATLPTNLGNVPRHQYDAAISEVIWWIVHRDLATLDSAERASLRTLHVDAWRDD